jgi:hypothetical protein
MRVLLLFALAGCVRPPTADRQAIVNGSADDGDAAVVALVDGDQRAVCSGALIGPYSILTAGHCFGDAGPLRVFFGSSLGSGGSFSEVAAIRRPSDFSGFTDDLALVTLRQPSSVAPLALVSRPLDASVVGATVTTVGFGITSATGSDSGVKRRGTARVTALESGDFVSAPDPAQPCAGDSGGPALLGDGSLAGVISHGDDACADHTVYARVDSALDPFIQPYLDSLAPMAAGLGERCFYDGNCASGACLAAADDPSLQYCGGSCRHDADCRQGMYCAHDGCRWNAPSPGALGAACAGASDCGDVGASCVDSVCSEKCDPIASACPAGFTCANTSGIEFACLRAESASGGCDASGGADPRGGGLWLMLGCAAALRAWSRRRCAASRPRGAH